MFVVENKKQCPKQNFTIRSIYTVKNLNKHVNNSNTLINKTSFLKYFLQLFFVLLNLT